MARKGFVEFGITGNKRLDKKLRAMESRVAGKAIRAGMKSAMEPVLTLARQRVPEKSGRLKRSLRVAGYAGKNFAGAAILTGTRKRLKISPKSKSYYPAFVEFGQEGVLARPFLRSSMADRKTQVLRSVVDEIKKALKTR